MKKPVGIALALVCLSSAGLVSAIEEKNQLRPGPQAVGYACVPSPKTGPVNVVMTPPPPGFKCPKGETLFLVTKQLQDRVVGAPETEAPVPGPQDPQLSSLPGSASQEVRAPKKKKTQRKCTSDGTGGQYCCTGGYSHCTLE